MAATTGPRMNPSGLPNWPYTLYGIVLAEYYQATGERWVLPELDEIRVALEDSQLLPNEPGKQLHGGWGHRPNYEGYGPIGILTAQGLTAYGLMMQAGLPVNPKNYEEAVKFIARGTNNIGYVWYADDGANKANRYADMGRTGMSAIAHSVSPKGGQAFLEIAARNAQCIGEHPQTFIDTHGSPILGIGWTAVGAATRPEALRRLMDYNRWFFNLSANPNGTFYYQPNRDSNDQDYATGNDLPGTVAVALALSVKYKSLRIMGARIYIEGIDPSQLTDHTKRAFELIGKGRYAPAYQVLVKAKTSKAGSGDSPPQTENDFGSDTGVINDEFQAIYKLLAYLDERLELTLVHIQGLDASEDVMALDACIEQHRATWGGVDAFDELVEPIVESLSIEPRRTSLRLGKALSRLLARAESQPSSANLRLLKNFAELHADHRCGQEAQRALEALESSSPEARDRYFEDMREKMDL